MNRRQFIRNFTAIIIGLIATAPFLSCNSSSSEKITFAISSDIHQDIIHDAPKRLSAFVKAAEERDVDFMIDLGDFCHPIPENSEFVNIWKNSPIEKYNALGNHDMDKGSKEDFMQFVGMKERYYSFDQGDFHFVVLDPNSLLVEEEYIPYENGNYYVEANKRGFIDPQQLEWLKSDLLNTSKQCIVFSHQSFDNRASCQNADKVIAIFEEVNRNAGFKKVVAAFSGHHHTDYIEEINEITYIQINSMSYEWVGRKYSAPERFSEEINERRPAIKQTIPYKDPLFAIVTINNGKITIEGAKTDFIPPGPEELNYDQRLNGISPTVPYISDRVIPF